MSIPDSLALLTLAVTKSQAGLLLTSTLSETGLLFLEPTLSGSGVLFPPCSVIVDLITGLKKVTQSETNTFSIFPTAMTIEQQSTKMSRKISKQ